MANYVGERGSLCSGIILFSFFGCFILLNHMVMLYHFLGDPWSDKWKRSEARRRIVKDVFTVSYFSLAVPLGLTILLIAVLAGVSKKNADVMGMQIIFGGILAGGMMTNRKLTTVFAGKESDSGGESYTSLIALVKGKKRWLWIVGLGFLLLSAGWESYRGQWIMWGLTITSGYQYLTFLWRLINLERKGAKHSALEVSPGPTS